jgi:hypothetical protein
MLAHSPTHRIARSSSTTQSVSNTHTHSLPLSHCFILTHDKHHHGKGNRTRSRGAQETLAQMPSCLRTGQQSHESVIDHGLQGSVSLQLRVTRPQPPTYLMPRRGASQTAQHGRARPHCTRTVEVTRRRLGRHPHARHPRFLHHITSRSK